MLKSIYKCFVLCLVFFVDLLNVLYFRLVFTLFLDKTKVTNHLVSEVG